jgi:hypothetical protein
MVKGLIPAAPKVNRRVELVTSKKTSSKLADHLLRKASSEPLLPLHPAYADNYAKLMAEKQRKEKMLYDDKHSRGHVVLHRNDFFKGRDSKSKNKAEGNGKTSEASDSDSSSSSSPPSSSIAADRDKLQTTSSAVSETEKGLQEPATDLSSEDHHHNSNSGTSLLNGFSNHHNQPTSQSSVAETNLPTNLREVDEAEDNRTRLDSPKLLSLEDEERFLRDLGWVPEEEAHVPELTEEEKLEVKKMLQQKAAEKNKTQQSLDNAIRRWQQEKFRENQFPIPVNQ